MKNFFTITNFFAQRSLARWNGNRYLRVCCRLVYLILIELYYYTPAEKRRREYAKNTAGANSYPRILQEVAKWPESCNGKDDGILVDSYRFVVRRSTSYCAYKIRELTGRGPKILYSKQRWGRERYDAKDWQEFLSLCGFNKVVTSLKADRYYIGIDPKYGEFGQLYWIEAARSDLPTDDGEYLVLAIASTYEDFGFSIRSMSDARLAELTIIAIA